MRAPARRAGPRRRDGADVRRQAEGFLAEALRWLGDATAAPATGTAADGAPRVLVVDDNADMRDYVAGAARRRLRGRDRARRRGRADAARARDPPDLVLTDVMMPNLDGFGLLGALRADPVTTGVPVIMLSARAGEEGTVEGLEAGADDYLIKPFAARELLARVRANLELDRARRTRDQLRRSQRLLDQAQRAGPGRQLGARPGHGCGHRLPRAAAPAPGEPRRAARARARMGAHAAPARRRHRAGPGGDRGRRRGRRHRPRAALPRRRTARRAGTACWASSSATRRARRVRLRGSTQDVTEQPRRRSGVRRRRRGARGRARASSGSPTSSSTACCPRRGSCPTRSRSRPTTSRVWRGRRSAATGTT